MGPTPRRVHDYSDVRVRLQRAYERGEPTKQVNADNFHAPRFDFDDGRVQNPVEVEEQHSRRREGRPTPCGKLRAACRERGKGPPEALDGCKPTA